MYALKAATALDGAIIMIKFLAPLTQGHLYGFGLVEAELNRLEYEREPIIFDFGFAKKPKIIGLIEYLPQFTTPEDIAANIDAVQKYCLRLRGRMNKNLRFFPISQGIMQTLRNKPYWGFECQVEIASPGDRQLLFAGKDEEEIKKYFEQGNFVIATNS